MGTKPGGERKHTKEKTPTFLLELPLAVEAGQAARLRAHLEAGRQFYNAALSAGQSRLRQMRADPAWQAARAISRTHTQKRRAAFSALRERYSFSEYAFHDLARELRVSWLADRLDAVLAQTLATRAYQALNRVCVGQARRVRFKSRGRGLSSIENKRNDTGLRFVLETPEEGNHGYLIWKDDQLLALIDWKDPVVKYGLDHRIKYARLLQRKVSSPQAQGAEASLSVFCQELAPDEQAVRRLQRKMDRQRRAANPDNYDSMGRIKKHGGKRGEKEKVVWKSSKTYQKTRRRKAAKERKLAAHRKSLHGRLVHEIVAVGNTIIVEKISYKAWQKQYGKSVGLRAPGMFIELLRRTVASTGGILIEVSTRTTKLSQYCHGCGQCEKKPLSQRWHQCACGIGPAQRDLYSAFLAAYLDPAEPTPSCAQYVIGWEGAEARLRAAHERTIQRANAGQVLPQSFGIPEPERVCPKVGAKPHKSCFSSPGGKVEAWKRRSEHPVL